MLCARAVLQNGELFYHTREFRKIHVFLQIRKPKTGSTIYVSLENSGDLSKMSEPWKVQMQLQTTIQIEAETQEILILSK